MGLNGHKMDEKFPRFKFCSYKIMAFFCMKSCIKNELKIRNPFLKPGQ